MTREQHSKRDRGRQHVGLHPKQEPKYGYCPQCLQPVHNRGAHAEACLGPRKRCEARTRGYGYAGVDRVCVRPWGHEGGHIYP